MYSYTDVILDDLSTHPHCPHGPTLLFKTVQNSTEKRFYACSACRDRKLCKFFHWADEAFTEDKKKIWEMKRQKLLPNLNPSELYAKFLKVYKKISKKQAGYCHTCCQLLLPWEVSAHPKHDLTVGVTHQQLSHPSELLKPLESNKKEAQYLFSKAATETIVKIAENIGIKYIISIGAPRIHEYINVDYHGNMRSVLLDIDHRYHSFYSEEEFCWFNSFNNYFFNNECSNVVLAKYLKLNKGKGMMIVMDPPFGGRVEPLAWTIQEIQKLHRKLNSHIKKNMSVILIYPYFMESHILASCPDYQMLDYKVLYENHSSFSQGHKGRKLGSPVRIFTNIAPENAPLPKEEGYHFCKLCKRWVSQENKHCKYCMKCTSKNGCTYTHCFKCNRCVKPTWKHCDKCQHCCLVPHNCGVFVPSSLCYNCGKTGHKKYDCPQESTKKEQTLQITGKKEKIKKRNHKEAFGIGHNLNHKEITKDNTEEVSFRIFKGGGISKLKKKPSRHTNKKIKH